MPSHRSKLVRRVCFPQYEDNYKGYERASQAEAHGPSCHVIHLVNLILVGMLSLFGMLIRYGDMYSVSTAVIVEGYLPLQSPRWLILRSCLAGLYVGCLSTGMF